MKALSSAHQYQIKKLERELSEFQMIPRKRQNSVSSQTIGENEENKRLKYENNDLRRSLEEASHKVKEGSDARNRLEIENENLKSEITRLSQNLANYSGIMGKFNELHQQLVESKTSSNNSEYLQTQLRASLDDRQVFEQRYLQVRVQYYFQKSQHFSGNF